MRIWNSLAAMAVSIVSLTSPAHADVLILTNEQMDTVTAGELRYYPMQGYLYDTTNGYLYDPQLHYFAGPDIAELLLSVAGGESFPTVPAAPAGMSAAQAQQMQQEWIKYWGGDSRIRSFGYP